MKYILFAALAVAYIIGGYFLMKRLDLFLAEVRSAPRETPEPSLRVGLERPETAAPCVEKVAAKLKKGPHAGVTLTRAPASELLKELKAGDLDVVILAALPYTLGSLPTGKE